MSDTLRRTWSAGLVAALALLYLWIGVVAHGWDRTLGLGGGVLILGAVAAARRWALGAFALLLLGALPLAVCTWWSIATPLIAILVLLLGGISIWHLRQPLPHPAPTTTALEPTA